ncbi:GAF domain-containing sensor histidine kinase [Lentzea sp. NPDC003310]|uniref:GAF domain-containing sensor histidine kinase n=1 Tax=Lentzea sp. NPDC003310 TaxID=3154447 RepID=UPI00339F20CA
MISDAWDAEISRVAAVRGTGVLDTPAEERFDRITRTARRLLNAPIALVSLVDLDRQWFKSAAGLDAAQTPRSESFCSHALGEPELMEVPDALDDPRFATNPMVVGPPHVRFYAGRPIAAASGHLIGTLCVLDERPRRLTPDERELLNDLAAWAEVECRAGATGDLVAVASHELRTPLTSVHGSLELLESGRFGSLPPQAERLVEIAVRNTDRLVRLTNDLMDLTLTRRGTLPLRIGEVGLASVTEQAFCSVAETARRAGVRLAERGPDVVVRGDADRLAQVLTNLLANAVKVSRPDTTVEVVREAGPLTARVQVRDEGPGIPPDQADRVFEPFVRLEAGARDGGAGLGLAITRGIVTAHGGTVAVTETSAAGTTFTLELPLAEPRG